MMERLDSLFGRWRPLPVAALGLLAASALGWIDFATGYELSISVFYLLPIAFVSWYGRRWAGALLCVASAVIWFAADAGTGRVYSSAWIPYWNALVRLGFFAGTSALLISMRRHLDLERDLARNDSLTGLLNGRAFREVCAGLFELARRHRRPLALAYLDLDDFKLVNDSRGHAEGDRLLRAVAETLRLRLRETDVVGRLAGDEFAIVLPDTTAEGAQVVLREVRARLVELFASEGWPAGASIGAVAFSAAPPTVDEALHRADQSMYAVKRSDKGALHVESAAEALLAG